MVPWPQPPRGVCCLSVLAAFCGCVTWGVCAAWQRDLRLQESLLGVGLSHRYIPHRHLLGGAGASRPKVVSGHEPLGRVLDTYLSVDV